MTPLAARVLREVQRHDLVRPGDRVLAALSGGPDSVALTLLLREVLPAVGAVLAGVAHLHHGLRGPEADADEAFCRRLASEVGVECGVERAGVAEYARRHKVSIEVAGHRLRHAFYDRARTAAQARVVATGHTANDLAETFLMRALRGAGLRSLAGIRASRPGLIRPMLSVSRQDVLTYLAEAGQPFREDATNRDTRIPRNRIRHELLPWLEDRIAPRAVEALARTATLAAVDEAFVRDAAAQAASGVRVAVAEGVGLDVPVLRGLPTALQRRIVLTALEEVAGRPGTAAAVDRLLDLTASPDFEGTVRFSGGRATLRHGRLVFAAESGRRPARTEEPPALAAPIPLPIPGSLTLSTGATIEVSRLGAPADSDQWELDESRRALIDAACLREPLGVRFRRPGDRLRPLGMSGHRKLQDLFVDRKVPRAERDDVPLVIDAEGRIVWVAGHVLADEVRVTSATTSVLLLQYRS